MNNDLSRKEIASYLRTLALTLTLVEWSRNSCPQKRQKNASSHMEMPEIMASIAYK